MRTHNGRRARAVIGVLAATAVIAPAVPAAADGGHPRPPKPPKVTVLASGLLNPRGVSVSWDGTVYVAESGVGGDTLAEALVEGEPSAVCLGNSGGVTRVRWGRAERIASFPSMTAAAQVDETSPPSCDPAMIGAASTGPSDVAVQLDGSVVVTVGLGGNGEVRAQLPPEFGNSLGKLFEISRRGRVSEIADISGYEDVANPDQVEEGLGEIDSNPYGVTSILGRHIVADAGGNDLVKVDRRGNVSTLTTFPMIQGTTVPDLSCPPPPGFPPAGVPIPAQPVPTSVTVGLDGHIYAGQLTGFPFNTGVANVWRVNPLTGAKRIVASGFTNIVGVAAALDGSLYVLEITRNGLLEGEICGDFAGRLVKVSRNGTQTEIEVPGGLSAPGGVAVGLDGTVYVTNNSVQPGGAGQLLAIRSR
jgi:hypothetical protein